MSETGAKRPRRKAKQERSRATIEVILEAAARVLLKKGYAAATTNRIAAAAGVSVGTVYEYYANKEAVFGDVIERELDALSRALQSRGPAVGASVTETLAQMIVAGFRAMRHGPELYRALEAVPNATFRRQLADARSTMIDFVEGLLEAHRAELVVDDLELAAFVVVSAAEGIAANATGDRFDERLGAEIVSLLSVYLAGSRDAVRDRVLSRASPSR